MTEARTILEFLAFAEGVKAEAETKMAAGGVDVDAVKRQAERPPRR
jgi:hypothetical protein